MTQVLTAKDLDTADVAVAPPRPDGQPGPLAGASMAGVLARLPSARGAAVLGRAAAGQRCACGGTIGADGMCDRCRAERDSPEVKPGGETRLGLKLHTRDEANTALARMLAGDTRKLQRMIACPPRLRDDEATPSGWKDYHGNPAVFHCGFRGILENRAPTPTDPMNECFYDHSGTLVDESHPYAGCRGTPDQYDSADHPLDHTFSDSGGIWAAGGPAFATSRVHDIDAGIAAAIGVVQAAADVVRSLADGFAEVVALGVMTGVATVDPANWAPAGLPARSMAHLNVMGLILSSAALAGNVDTLLRNLTRRLSSFPIATLMTDLAADINQVQPPAPGGAAVTAQELGGMSMFQLVEFLNTRGLLRFQRAPEEVARARLAAERATSPGTPAP